MLICIDNGFSLSCWHWQVVDKSTLPLNTQRIFCILIRKMFSCACWPILFWGMAQKHYKITVSKGDICKHASSMLNVSGMFFIISGVSWLMNIGVPPPPPKVWATQIFWAARENLGKASFWRRFHVFHYYYYFEEEERAPLNDFVRTVPSEKYCCKYNR